MSHAFILDGTRTPIGRYGGALAAVRPDDLAAHIMRSLIDRHPEVNPSEIDEVVLGCGNQSGEDNRNVARMASLLAGVPESVPGVTVNRLCGSGLEAVASAARLVHCGDADVVIAGGVESMTRAPMTLAKPMRPFERSLALEDSTLGWRSINPVIEQRFGVDPLGVTAENVADEFGISRVDQDAFALRSQERAAAKIASGIMAVELTAVPVARGRDTTELVDADEHPRATTLEGLAKLPAVFRNGGTVTAGNSSGINDGAAALLVVSERFLERTGQTPLARIVGTATVGVAPRVMGIGPIPATQRLLERYGETIDRIGVIELNEAFAAQVLAVLRALGLPDDAEHVNPGGGAIALGHPIGMSGARLALSAARELDRRRERLGLVTMCIGVGQGISMLLAGAASKGAS